MAKRKSAVPGSDPGDSAAPVETGADAVVDAPAADTLPFDGYVPADVGSADVGSADAGSADADSADADGADGVVAEAAAEDTPTADAETAADSLTDDLGEGALGEADAAVEDDAVPFEDDAVPVEDDVADSAVEDPAGEILASELPDPGPYEIADDEDSAEELDDGPESDDEPSSAELDELEEAEEAAVEATSTRPVRRAPSPRAPVKKDAPTRSRKDAAAVVTDKRTGPVTFVKQSIAELRKVVWPTGSQMGQYFVVVLIFVVVMIAVVSLLDFAFGWALLKLLG